METGLLNFHDEETFATSMYDQGDFIGVDGQGSLLDVMHSDLQYSSDYLNQSAAHWDSDQEQEHNGDLAVLPVAPSESSSLNSSKEDYNKSLFEWQDNLIPYQPLDPNVVDLRLDGHIIQPELPDNIFEDSFESSSSSSCVISKSSTPALFATPGRCSTPNLHLKDTNTSTDGSLNLDVSLSALDVNVSDIDVSALGINVSSLDIKTEGGDTGEVKCLTLPENGDNLNISGGGRRELVEHKVMVASGKLNVTTEDKEENFAALFGLCERNPIAEHNVAQTTFTSSVPVLNSSPSAAVKLENTDVEQLHDIAMEFIKEEQQAETWNNLPLLDAPLDCNVDLDSISAEVPVLEAGNLESLLEQFEATLKPVPEFSQSMPASPAPAHFYSIPPSPLSMPASPSCVNSSPLSQSTSSLQTSKSSPLPSPGPSPSKFKAETPNKVSPAKLHQNILNSLPSEIMDRIKASGRKKAISLIPAMPSKKPSRSSTRMHAAGATLSRNKLLKLVSRKGTDGESIQFDHDYCSNDSLSHLEFVPDHVVKDIKANTKHMDCDEDKQSRKDSGLESGDVSEDSEGALATSTSDLCCTGPKVNRNSILKPRGSNITGRSKEMLMVSVLKKVRSDSSEASSRDTTKVHQRIASQPSQSMKSRNLVAIDALPKSPSKSLKPVINPADPVAVPKFERSACSKLVSTSEKTAHCTPPNSVKPSPKCHGSSNTSTINPVKTEISGSEKFQPNEELKTSVISPERLDSTPDKLAVIPPEQPKKRKLNLEEYHNRLKAIEQKRENSALRTSLVTIIPSPSETIIANVRVKAEKPEVALSVEKEESNQTVAEKRVIDCVPAVIKKEKCELKGTETDNECPISSNMKKENMNACMETATVRTPPADVSECNPHVTPRECSPVIEIVEEEKSVEDKKKQRQYRARNLSTSSSEGSPSARGPVRSRFEKSQRKSEKAQPKSRSRSASSAGTRSRSVSRSSSSSSSRSSSSSSSNSSSSSDSTNSNRRQRKVTKNKRLRRRTDSRSCSRGRSTSGSSSSHRSNSISSGSSRHSSRRSRRSRSRSSRRSRRDNSTSRNRSRGSWRRRRRDSTRSRRGCFSNRSRRSISRSSLSRSWSRSRSRSRTSWRQRYDSRSPAGRRWPSYSSQSKYRFNSRARSWSSGSGSFTSSDDFCRSRSRIRSHTRERAKVERRGRAKKTDTRPWRSRSPMRRSVDWSRVGKEHDRQVEERRVVYVGRIPEDTTKAELRRRFEVFGPIVDISLHFREHADNYGFVTFAYQSDAYEAVERGNDDKTQPRYDLCFGGRRKFCRQRYADLDGMASKSGAVHPVTHISRNHEANSFDDMLRELKAKLQSRKKL